MSENYTSLAQMDIDYPDSGKAINIELAAKNGQRLRLTFDKASLAELISSLTEAAFSAARLRTADKAAPMDHSQQLPLTATGVSQVGLAQGEDSQFYMILHVLDFDLFYRIPSRQLRHLAKGFSEAAERAETQSPQRN